jgi:tetratricopeptide (TPR) repeat protein
MRRSAVFLLFLFLAVLFVHAVYSHDFWWHLATGRYIACNRAIPHTDIYSQASYGKPWIDMQWLFELVIFGVYKLFNIAGIVLFKTLVLLAVFFILFKSVYRRERAFAAIAISLLCALSFWERTYIRPEIFTFLYLAVFLYILHRYKYSTPGKYIYFIPVIQLLWVNSHGLFILGAVVVWSFVLGEFLSARNRMPFFKEDTVISGKNYFHLTIAAVLSLIVFFINPYGFQGALFPYTLFTHISGQYKILSLTIGEFNPSFSYLCRDGAVIFYKILIAFSALCLVLNAKRLPFSQIILYGIFLYLSLLARRNISLFALVCLPVTVENLCQYLERRKNTFYFHEPVQLSLFFAISLILLFCINDLVHDGRLIRNGVERKFSLGLAPFKFPEGAASFVLKHDLKGNIFNDLQGGNYLIWRFYPNRKVLFDGRLEVHSTDFYAEYVRLQESPASWESFAQKYSINYALFSHRDPDMDKLLVYLYHSPRWKLVFCDDLSVVFLKNSPENKAVIKSCEIVPAFADFPSGNIIALSDDDKASLYLSRGNLFARFGVYDKARDNYVKSLIFKPYNSTVCINMGILYQNAGHYDEAIERYEAALPIPAFPPLALFNLGNLYYERGDFPAALNYFYRAATADQSFSEAYFSAAGICMLCGEYERAENLYSQLLKTRPWHLETMINLGVVYAKEGRSDKARRKFLEALDVDPGNDSALNDLKLLGGRAY